MLKSHRPHENSQIDTGEKILPMPLHWKGRSVTLPLFNTEESCSKRTCTSLKEKESNHRRQSHSKPGRVRSAAQGATCFNSGDN